METSVTCRICGHSAVTLARHLKAVHGVTADVYRAQFPGARIRSEACEANRRQAIAASHAASPRKGLKKIIQCPTCGQAREVGLTFVPTTHEMRCVSCVAEAENAKWAVLVEGQDYVTCQGCGYRAENLTSHIQNSHPDWVGCYSGQIVALNSAVRDKTALKGLVRSAETRARMAASAGWNRGLTKETDARVARAAGAMVGRTAWSKGLTKVDHPSLQSTSSKLSVRKKGVPNDAARLDLSMVDFTPYLDETGAVDRKTMAEELGISEPTVTKYMESIGLRLSTKYVDARVAADIESGRLLRMNQVAVERATIRLTLDDLAPFRLRNGRVSISRAMAGLGHVYAVIKRECDRLGIPTYRRLIRQGLCLSALAQALGGVPYEEEWRSWAFVNPTTGHRFRFDGYFPSHSLIVEFHGYQHYVFPSVYIQDEALYFEQQERDRIKENLVHAHPELRYFLVREDEPYTDPDYLRGRLLDEGFLDP